LRQHLDTAPVLEAMRAGGECPMCGLEKHNEDDYAQYFLGGSVMEVATRLEVNQKGFCAQHLNMLFEADNRLGLALMERSHLIEVISRLKNAPTPQRRLFKKAEVPDGGWDTCTLCDRLEKTMRRYALTVAALWEKEPDFRGLLKDSRGFCLPHYEMIRAEAPGALSGRALEAFYTVLDEVEIQNLERLQREVDWFTQKHDYRNADKPWGDSRDSVERCAKKLRGNWPRPR
jgi:hypothetical protein